jgi:hypothetical protein
VTLRCAGRVSSVQVQAQQPEAMSSIDRLSYDKVCIWLCHVGVLADHDVLQKQ